jgi:hypothetical protein
MRKPDPSAHPALLELGGDGTTPFTPAPVQALLQAAKHNPEEGLHGNPTITDGRGGKNQAEACQDKVPGS